MFEGSNLYMADTLLQIPIFFFGLGGVLLLLLCLSFSLNLFLPERSLLRLGRSSDCDDDSLFASFFFSCCRWMRASDCAFKSSSIFKMFSFSSSDSVRTLSFETPCFLRIFCTSVFVSGFTSALSFSRSANCFSPQFLKNIRKKGRLKVCQAL